MDTSLSISASSPHTKVENECRNPNCPYKGAAAAVIDAKLKQCSRCQQACYCCKSCQVSHWKEHNKECKKAVKHGARLIGSEQQQAMRDNPVLKPTKEFKQELLAQWKASMPPFIAQPNRDSAWQRLSVSFDHIVGLQVGDWPALMQGAHTSPFRFAQLAAPGDRVRVHPGNDLKSSLVGQTGTLIEKVGKKWGVDMDRDQPTLILAGNLERIDNS